MRVHQRTCAAEQARSAAWVRAVEEGRSPLTDPAAMVGFRLLPTRDDVDQAPAVVEPARPAVQLAFDVVELGTGCVDRHGAQDSMFGYQL